MRHPIGPHRRAVGDPRRQASVDPLSYAAYVILHEARRQRRDRRRASRAAASELRAAVPSPGSLAPQSAVDSPVTTEIAWTAAPAS